MKTHDLIQGSPEWLAYRAGHFNASDAPAMMGVSPYKTRADLLRELHTGLVPQVDAGTQKRFDNGHRLEALARPLAEEFIGAELYPVTGSEGRLSASFDGLTLDGSEGFEHKALNNELRKAFAEIETIAPKYRDDVGSRELLIYHRIQMEQQLLVSGAQRILFMTSEWSAEDDLIEEHHCWYYSDPALRHAIVQGWQQFKQDLTDYVVPAAAKPVPLGKTPETLPALRIEVTGKVTASNLAEFKETALAAIRSVNRELITDEHFADAEQGVKWCADVESRLEAAKRHALSQTADIDLLFKTIDDISAEARRVRLDLNKLVTDRKAAVKVDIVATAIRAYEQHEEALRKDTGGPWIVLGRPDFASAIKSLRTVTSIQNAVDTTLSAAKIRADESARKIRESLRILADDGAGFEFLFPDRLALIGKAPDDLRLLVNSRIDAHNAAAAEKRRKAAEVVAPVAAPAPVVAPITATPVRVAAPMPAIAPRIDEPATLKLGAICDRLGFALTGAFVSDTLGIKPVKTEGASKLYRESDFWRICCALQQHITDVSETVAEQQVF